MPGREECKRIVRWWPVNTTENSQARVGSGIARKKGLRSCANIINFSIHNSVRRLVCALQHATAISSVNRLIRSRSAVILNATKFVRRTPRVIDAAAYTGSFEVRQRHRYLFRWLTKQTGRASLTGGSEGAGTVLITRGKCFTWASGYWRESGWSEVKYLSMKAVVDKCCRQLANVCSQRRGQEIGATTKMGSHQLGRLDGERFRAGNDVEMMILLTTEYWVYWVYWVLSSEYWERGRVCVSRQMLWVSTPAVWYTLWPGIRREMKWEKNRHASRYGRRVDM